MKIGNNPIIYLFKKFWLYSKGNRKKVVLFFGLSILAHVTWLSETLIVAHVFNTIQLQGIHKSNFVSLLLNLSILIGTGIVFWALHGPSRVLETKNGFLVGANYRKYMLDGVLELPVAWHTDHHSGDTIDKISKGERALHDFSSDLFITTQSAVHLIMSYIVLSYYNFSAIYIVAIIFIFTIWIILKFDKVLIKQYSELYKAENGISAKIFDVISNITTVIILRIEKLVAKAIFKKIMQPFALFSRNTKLNETKWFAVSMCGILMTFTVIGSYLYNVAAIGATVAIGTIFALYGYVQKITELFFNFAYRYGEIVRQKTAVVNAEEITKEFKKKKKITEIELGGGWKELNIKSLNFSYHQEGGADLHLDNINFVIKHAQKIAVIGESGSGKTTFLKIMRALYDPKTLKLFLDGVLLKHGFNSISHAISLIPQDPEIFNTTVKENITIGVEHEMRKIKKFTDMAEFTEVAERLPKKFESSIVEKGVNLSGGEKQRLALSRGLLASEDKEIVLLDEPTSSVDFKNEMNIYKNIFEKFSDKVVISSVHRLHLLPLFDNIYLFKNGKIAASGNFKNLLDNSEDFKVIWQKYISTTTF